MQQVEARLEILACTVGNEPVLHQLPVPCRKCRHRAYLSPCIRGLLRLGLATGVRSRALPACSKSFSAFDSKDASTGSELRLRLW